MAANPLQFFSNLKLPSMTMIGVIAYIIMLMFLIILVAFFLLLYFRNKHKVKIYEPLGKEKEGAGKHAFKEWKTYRARIVIEDGIEKLKCFGHKEKMKPYATPFINKKGNKEFYYLRRGSSLVPWGFTYNTAQPSFTDLDDEIILWGEMQRKELSKRFLQQSFMEKYGHYIALGGVIAAFCFMVIMMKSEVGAMIDMGTTAAQQCVQQSQVIGNI